MVDALALLLDHTWTHTDRQPGNAPAPAPLCQWQSPARCLATAPAPAQGAQGAQGAQRAGTQGAQGAGAQGAQRAGAQGSHGQVQSTGTAALQRRVTTELGSALAGIVSAYWSHATNELQLALLRGSARNSALHAALVIARAEGEASNAEVRALGESNNSLRLDLATQQKVVRLAQVHLDTTGAELGAARAELFQLRAELFQLRAELGQTRAERDQTRTELEATRTEQEATLAKANSTWNVLCQARHEIALNLDKLSAAVANGDCVVAERQSMLKNAAQWAARAEDASRGLMAARADAQSLRSELAAEAAQGAVAARGLQSLRSELEAEVAQETARAAVAARDRRLLHKRIAAAVAEAAKAAARAAVAEGSLMELRSEVAAPAKDLVDARAVILSLRSELAAAEGAAQAAVEGGLVAENQAPRSVLAARAAAEAEGATRAQAASDDEARLCDRVHRGRKRPRSPPGQGYARSGPEDPFNAPTDDRSLPPGPGPRVVLSGILRSTAMREYIAAEKLARGALLDMAVLSRDAGNALRAAQASVREARGGEPGGATTARLNQLLA